MLARGIRGLLKEAAERKVIALGEEERIRENAFLGNLLLDWLFIACLSNASFRDSVSGRTSSRRECDDYQVPECRNGFEGGVEDVGLTKNMPNCEFEESTAHINTSLLKKLGLGNNSCLLSG